MRILLISLFILSLPAFAANCGPYHPPSSLLIPVVQIENAKHDRQTVDQYAFDHNLDKKILADRYAPSGLMTCGTAHGAAQITGADNVLTTASHVLYDEMGFMRDGGRCTFSLWVDGKRVDRQIDLSTLGEKNLRVGTRFPYTNKEEKDWAVLRLPQAVVAGVRPYEIVPPGFKLSEGQSIRLVTRGHIDWKGVNELSIENCNSYRSARMQTTYEATGTHRYNLDCSGSDGASGGSVFITEGPYAGRMIGTYGGWVARKSQRFQRLPYSQTHTNFYISIEDDYQKAVQEFSEPSV